MQLIAIFRSQSLIDKNIFEDLKIGINCIATEEIVNRNRMIHEVEIERDGWWSTLYLRSPSKDHIRLQADALLH